MSEELFTACEEGNFEKVKALIVFEKTITARKGYGENIINVSARNGHLKILKLLIESYPLYQDFATTISIASGQGQLEVVKYLVETVKYNLEQSNWHDDSHCIDICEHPLCCAVENGHIELVKYFIENGVENDHVIKIASYFGRLNIIEYLVENGCKLVPQCFDNAVKNGQFQIIEYIVKNGVIGNLDLGIRNAIIILVQGNKFISLNIVALFE